MVALTVQQEERRPALNDDLRFSIDWGKYQTVTLERRDDGVLLITVAEPAGAPAATLARRHTKISHVWRDFADDPDLRVAVITGRAEKFWTVDGDDGIEEMLRTPATTTALSTSSARAWTTSTASVNCDKPVVSAINGEAMGSGLAVALLAAISGASTDARLIDGHLRRGIAAGDHSVMIWPLLCGLAKAKLYLLASEDLTGEVARAHRMAVGPQHALRWTKRSLNHWLRTSIPAFEASLGFEALSFFWARPHRGAPRPGPEPPTEVRRTAALVATGGGRPSPGSPPLHSPQDAHAACRASSVRAVFRRQAPAPSPRRVDPGCCCRWTQCGSRSSRDLSELARNRAGLCVSSGRTCVVRFR